MSITSRPYFGKSAKEFDRIFKKAERAYREGRIKINPDKYVPDDPKPVSRIIDKATGKPPTQAKLNQLYGEFKRLKEDLKSQLCSRDEHWNPTEHNVRKVMERECAAGSAKITQFQRLARVVGVEPDDSNINRLRKGWDKKWRT